MPDNLSTRASQLFPSAHGGVELFDEFFESGKEESISPFLTPDSRIWGKNLSLKSSLIAALLLFFAFLFSFFPTQHPFSNLLLLLTYFFAGIPALIDAVEDLLNLEINIDVLMTLAAFLSVLIGSGREGALLLVLFSFSGSLETVVSSKAKSAISSLKQIASSKAFVIQADGSLLEKSVKDIAIGSKIHIKAGQLVPLDGKVLEGVSFVNLVHLTGESLPLRRSVGDLLPAGARTIEGAFTLEVTQTSSDSTLARMIQLITQAQEAKPRLQSWLDKFSNRYAISVILCAFLVGLILPWFTPLSYLGKGGSIYRALAFLIAASPCALIIAIPIAYLSAISVCAKKGILLKGGIVLDALAQCKTLAMDKTGTLTTGEFSFLGLELTDPTFDPWPLAYSLERSAVHPLARAVMHYAETHHISLISLSAFRVIPGYGLEGEYQGQKVSLGNPEWIFPKLTSTQIQKLSISLAQSKKKGETVALLHYGENAALFRFQDTIRTGAKETLRMLKEKWGMRLLMLTGDHHTSAEAIAKEVGIEEFYADLRPEDKLAYISKEPHLAMIGDGINDAPALARANVGISMGKVGSTTAIDASDIILLQDNFELLEWLVKKSRQVVRIVKENLIIALGAIIFATLPALLGWIPLWLAVILHEGGTVLVGFNALRLLKTRF